MKKSVGSLVFDIFNIVFLSLFALICIFPFWNIFALSFVGANEFYNSSIILIPKEPNPIAYLFIFSSTWIFNGFKTSLIITVIGTTWTLFLNSTVAYGLNSEKLPGKKYFLIFFIIPSYFAGGLVPFYYVITKFLHLGDTIFALCMCYPVTVFSFLLFRTFFREIPKSLIESARIDGAGEYYILFKIILPLSKPVFATLTLFISVGFWNEWFNAQLFMTDDSNYPLQLILRKIVIENDMASRAEEIRKIVNQRYGIDTNRVFMEAIKAAVVMVTTIPIVCVYPFLQKYFAKGVMIGAINK